MKIQAQIQADMISAMKVKDNETKSLLKVVLGEFDRLAKDIDDNKATTVIKKMHQTATELSNQFEISILEKYLPTFLSEADAKIQIEKVLVDNSLSTMRDMGTAMKLIKTKFGTSIDGKYASTIVKNILA